MEISDRQLRRMVADVDDQHRDAMKTFEEENKALIFGDLRHETAMSRRRVLTGIGLGGAALTIGSAVVPFSSLLRPADAQEGPSDSDLARFAASFEFAAVQAYAAALETGRLSDGVVQAGQKFAGHHDEHGKAFAGFIGEEIPANQTILDTFGPQIANAPDEKAIVEIAFSVENAAASTYLLGLGVLQDPKAFQAAASILPVESQHAVTLGFVLGRDVSDQDLMPAFEPTDTALDPAMFPIEA